MAVVELQRLLDALAREHQLQEIRGDLPTTISSVADHTDDVIAGSLFCAVQGSNHDGHQFVTRASEQGATAFLVSRATGNGAEIVVANDRIATAIAAAEFFDRPADKLTLIGVTGTNGKSTTVHLTRHLLNTVGNVGMIGTLGASDGSGEALYSEKLTTPGPVALHQTLAELVRRNTTTVVLESSSHALHQQRLYGIPLDVGIFTNMSRDHLDYHGTWEEYVVAKASMVNHIKPRGWQIVNADQAVWSGLALPMGQRRYSFGLRSAADLTATIVGLGPRGATLRLTFPEPVGSGDGEVLFPLLGEFNVSNALAAAACALALGVQSLQISERLATAPQVTGRMERIGSEGFVILRDYSHTPDSLKRALRAARPLTSGRLLVLFGCGGDRDRGKRAQMGKIAVSESDLALVTSDNPRTEDPDQIIADIEEGMEGNAYVRIVDRRQAIAQAIAMMEPEDCLLLAGKGHETYQVLGKQRVPFDEAKIVAEEIRARSGG